MDSLALLRDVTLGQYLPGRRWCTGWTRAPNWSRSCCWSGPSPASGRISGQSVRDRLGVRPDRGGGPAGRVRAARVPAGAARSCSCSWCFRSSLAATPISPAARSSGPGRLRIRCRSASRSPRQPARRRRLDRSAGVPADPDQRAHADHHDDGPDPRPGTVAGAAPTAEGARARACDDAGDCPAVRADARRGVGADHQGAGLARRRLRPRAGWRSSDAPASLCRSSCHCSSRRSAGPRNWSWRWRRGGTWAGPGAVDWRRCARVGSTGTPCRWWCCTRWPWCSSDRRSELPLPRPLHHQARGPSATRPPRVVATERGARLAL